MKILLSDGSGLTSKQVADRLAAAGHHVEALSPDPLCICRFTRHVRRIRKVPAYGRDPFGWLDAAIAAYVEGGFDLLFPTQEQVAVLAATAGRWAAAGVRTAVPSFDALRAVQDKVTAFATLTRLGIPQPESAVVHAVDELRAWSTFPVFVKTPIGTATSGVRRVEARSELEGVDDLHQGALLLQAPAEGDLVMVQTVFAHGELVASHANLRVRLGARGGASHKRSIDDPVIRSYIATLGRDLQWHGALSADVILTADGPVVIDVNPRLVEPFNAWRAGVDLVGAMVDVALGAVPAVQPPGRPGVPSHQLVLAVLGAAEQGRGRRGVAAELRSAFAHRGSYRDSVEELAAPAGDWRAVVPLVVAAGATLIRPAWWHWFASGSVTAYALTPAAYEQIVASLRK